MNLTMSEVMTISLYFHYSGYATFKDYYTKHIQKYCNSDDEHFGDAKIIG